MKFFSFVLVAGLLPTMAEGKEWSSSEISGQILEQLKSSPTLVFGEPEKGVGSLSGWTIYRSRSKEQTSTIAFKSTATIPAAEEVYRLALKEFSTRQRVPFPIGDQSSMSYGEAGGWILVRRGSSVFLVMGSRIPFEVLKTHAATLDKFFSNP
jgi:hypothetical protein